MPSNMRRYFSYVLIMILGPTLAILPAVIKTKPTIILTALNTIAKVYPPLSLDIKAPAIGVPVKSENATILNVRFIHTIK